MSSLALVNVKGFKMKAFRGTRLASSVCRGSSRQLGASGRILATTEAGGAGGCHSFVLRQRGTC